MHLPKALAQTLKDTLSLKSRLEELANPSLKPSAVYHLLHGLSPQAITASLIASDSPAARRNIQLYLDKLRYVKTILGGDDLMHMGIPPGPRIKETLGELLDRRLDGQLRSRVDEERRVMRTEPMSKAD